MKRRALGAWPGMRRAGTPPLLVPAAAAMPTVSPTGGNGWSALTGKGGNAKPTLSAPVLGKRRGAPASDGYHPFMVLSGAPVGAVVPARALRAAVLPQPSRGYFIDAGFQLKFVGFGNGG